MSASSVSGTRAEKKGDEMKKQKVLSSSFAKLFLLRAPLQERRITFYRKSFLVIILTFAALSLGRSREARGDFVCDDWGCYEVENPYVIPGLSTLHYTCTTGQLTNTVTLGSTPTANDSFVTSGPNISCSFSDSTTETCSYQLTWTAPNLVQCNIVNGNAVVTVRAQCDNANVSGSLVCPAHGTDLLGISSISECRRLFGRNSDILFTQIIFGQTSCDAVLNASNTGSFKLEGVTQTTTKVCHSDFQPQLDCITPNGTNTSISDLPNLARTACEASPTKWNVDCSGNKDNGNGTVCFVNAGAGTLSSFDPTTINGLSATLNGVPVDLINSKNKPPQASCSIKDCNGDGVPDFQCTFPTCFAPPTPPNAPAEPTALPPLAAAPGELTMIANFTNNPGGGLICTATVGTTP